MAKKCKSCDELESRVERLEKRLDSTEALAHSWHMQWQKEHEKRQKAEGIISLRDAEIAQLKQKIEKLEAQVQHLQKLLFEKSSEAAQESNEVELAEAVGLPLKRKRGKQAGEPGFGRKVRFGLEVCEIERDVAKADKRCPKCRTRRPLLPFTEDSEEIDYQWKLVRIKHKRLKYGLACTCTGVQRIVTAPIPSKVIPKGLFTTAFWTYILIEKYLLQRPLSKIAFSLNLQGLQVSDGTLSSGLKRLTKSFAPLYNAFRSHNRSALHWQMDETHWRVFEDKLGKDNHKWWLWVALTSDTVIFRLDPSRSSKVPTDHLKGIVAGFLTCDRYSAYKPLSENIKLSYCWAHVRRDFIKLRDGYPALKRFAQRWIDNIDQLFHQNKLRLSAKGTPAFAKENAELVRLIESMSKATKRALSRKPHQAAADVLTSLQKHWHGLTLFVEHPDLPMDNNASERALRGAVVGRKNYYGNHSVWGGHLAAMLFSIFGTIGKFRLDPYRYLSEYLQCCAQNGGRPPDDLSDFLPWVMTEQRKQELALPTVA